MQFSQRQPLPQQPHQGRSRVKAKSLAALSAFDDDVLELEERDRELRSLPSLVSLVVVVESPSSIPDSVTDSNLGLFFLGGGGSFFDNRGLRCFVTSFSFSWGGGPTMSSPGTLPLRRMPLTVRLVAVATRWAEGGGGAVDVDECDVVVVVFKGSSKTTEERCLLPLPLQLALPLASFLCEASELLESVLEMCLFNLRPKVLVL